MTDRLVFLVTEDWAFWRHRRPMAGAARDAGFDVHLITKISNRAAAIASEGFTVHNVDYRRGSLSPRDTLKSVIAVRRLLTELKPDLIHNVALKPLVVGSLAATGLSRVGIVNSINGLGSAFIPTTLRGRLVRHGLRQTMKAVLGRSNARVIVQNPEDFSAVKALGIDARNLIIVPGSGVDCDLLQPIPEPPPEPIRIAFVGRMLDDKGLKSLMRAHALLTARGETIELLLAGEPDYENPTSITRAEFDAWSQLPLVRCLGHVETIADVWKQAHIAVLPSRGEGLPKSLLEAAACGRPVIGTDVPGCREIVIPNETGLMVNVDDDIGLANAMSELAHDKAKRERMGRAGRLLTEARFSSIDIGLQTVAVYRNLLETAKAGEPIKSGQSRAS
jgi:glycosyltransferase involved in cell wall biosynthesis